MNILFISLSNVNSIEEHGLYQDALRQFVNNGHKLVVVYPAERRTGKDTEFVSEEQVSFLRVKTGNIQKTNYIEKGISMLLLSSQLKNAINKYCKNVKFDLILYATPPITICGLVKKLKKITKAKTFLMLKDIWPQEMIDLGLISENGLICKYFRNLERKIYKVSDYIGCTSPANSSYVLKHNPDIDKNKVVQVCNSVDINYPIDKNVDKKELCEKYGICSDKKIFFYGGNLGKPQDIDFVIECLKTQLDKKDRFFVICGGGTEYLKLERFIQQYAPVNVKLISYLPRVDYDRLIAVSDVGLVFLNCKFTVPNCPTRFYAYMEYGKPVFACTDSATDIREDIEAGNFGWWCESSSVESFETIAEEICSTDEATLTEMGKRARKHLEENYSVEKDYQTIIKCLENSRE